MTPQPDVVTTDDVYAPPPPYLSPSSIDTFNTCPLKYRYSRVDKLPDPSGIDAVRGNFVHDTLERLLALPAEHRTVASARTIMASVWGEQRQGRTRDDGTFDTVEPYSDEVARLLDDHPDALRQFRWQAWWCVENYFKLEDPASVTPAGLEHQLDGEIEGVRIKGYIDRWSRRPNGMLTVTDYKSGKTPYGQYREPKFVQLLIYADLLAREQNAKVALLELLYLKTGDRLVKAPRPADLDAMRRLVTTTSTAINTACATGEFPATPSKLCDYCSFRSMCPIWNPEKDPNRAR